MWEDPNVFFQKPPVQATAGMSGDVWCGDVLRNARRWDRGEKPDAILNKSGTEGIGFSA